MDVPKYTVLDDSTHVIAEDEHTVCGLVIPHGNGYTIDEPKKLCRKCRATEEADEVEEVDDRPATKATARKK